LIAEKFSDPLTFLARLEHASCRVAILDVWMPQMNGLVSAGPSPPRFAGDTDHFH
jgi:Response regulator containing CheY-like receiver, AAA-type ATPase, and DNA-binding domains